MLQVSIPKPDGGQRLLGIPTVLDRLIQQAILQQLTPLFDPFFSESSFGFRPNRNAHGAVKQIEALAKQGYRVAVDIDLAKFFDHVPHGLLMAEVAKKVKDKGVLHLIGLYLRAGVWVNGVFQPTDKGVPQGSPLSPLLANILLDRLDKELEKRGHHFARYADDLMLLVKAKRAAQRVMASLKGFLLQKLHLPVNEQKSKVAPLEDCSFLGFNLKRGKMRWSEKTERKFKDRIRQITSRSRGCSMEKVLAELRLYLRGWINYFGLSNDYRPIPGLDDWIRRRVRMCYWKQWKRPRTRIRNLLKLGAFRKQAVSTGRSSKGYWRLSKTLATQSAMTNLWLEQQGLLSLKTLWISLAPFR